MSDHEIVEMVAKPTFGSTSTSSSSKDDRKLVRQSHGEGGRRWDEDLDPERGDG